MGLLPEQGKRELGFTPYVWLAWFLIFLARPVISRVSWWERGLVAATIPVFVFFYFGGFSLSGRRVRLCLLGMIALGVAWIPFNPGASVFFVYAAASAGAVGPPRVAVRWLLGVVAVAGLEAAALNLSPHAWLPAVVVSLIVGAPNIHFIETARSNARLLRAQQEVEHMAQVAERERIARDLHDLLGHTLSLIVLKSELAGKLADRDPAAAAAEIRDVETIARRTLAEVRRAVQGYRSRGLAGELAGLRPALEAAEVELHAELSPVALTAANEGALALALREAITNVVRHARARNCWVTLSVSDGSVQLEVRDDGRGGDAPDGSGLLGMRERVESLGGRLDRDGRSGTRLRVSLPQPLERSA